MRVVVAQVSTRERGIVRVIVFAACAGLAACESSSVNLVAAGPAGGTGGSGANGQDGNGGAGATPSGGSGGASAGSGGESGSAGSDAGTDADADAGACEPECAGAAPFCEQGRCVQCLAGSKRCLQELPQECREGGWVALAACPGSAPVCTNGACAGARFTGAFVVAQDEVGTAERRLRDHGFEFPARACAPVAGATTCVTGGFRP
jgi:hypothetical protein